MKRSMAVSFRLSLLGLTPRRYEGLEDFSEEHAAQVFRTEIPLQDRCQFPHRHRVEAQNITA
jgi:hypothetical protein